MKMYKSKKCQYEKSGTEKNTELFGLEELEIEKHINHYLGKVDYVFHEVVSDQLHIDILQFHR